MSREVIKGLLLDAEREAQRIGNGQALRTVIHSPPQRMHVGEQNSIIEIVVSMEAHALGPGSGGVD